MRAADFTVIAKNCGSFANAICKWSKLLLNLCWWIFDHVCILLQFILVLWMLHACILLLVSERFLTCNIISDVITVVKVSHIIVTTVHWIFQQGEKQAKQSSVSVGIKCNREELPNMLPLLLKSSVKKFFIFKIFDVYRLLW